MFIYFRPIYFEMLNNLTTSIVIRALNEQLHIGKLLYGIQQQTKLPDEIILVDSGSTDDTLLIASSYEVKIEKISKQDFTFGRALNIGCNLANNDILIFLSAHVYPLDKNWLSNLIKPFEDDSVACSYGKQRGNAKTKFSEHQVFLSYFPNEVADIKTNYFCNNANCAIRKKAWQKIRYDEDLTGLEDLDWAKKQHNIGNKIVYVPSAEIIHVHEESWRQIKNRYKREAIALRRIESHISMNFFNLTYLIFLSIFSDLLATRSIKSLRANWISIIFFRFNQYLGTYEGLNLKNNEINQLKSTFYYPPRKIKENKGKLNNIKNSNNNEKLKNLINYDSF